MSTPRFRRFLPLVALALALAPVAACRHEPWHSTRPFDSATAFHYVEQQVAFGPRVPGTPAHKAMAAWLDSLLRARADTVMIQQWSHVTVAHDTLQLTNFIARFNPSATKRLLFLAHWDSRPHADSKLSSDSTKPVPGANDGGSGVAVLLGVADALHKTRLASGVGVDLLFDDGEDYGNFTAAPNDVLMGARYYAQHQLPGPAPVYAVLFDMVGDKELQIYQEGYSSMGVPDVVERVWNTARKIGYGDVFVPRAKHTLIDDHVELQKAGLRAIDVVDFDYPSWHTPNDTMDKVSAASLGIVGTVALGLIQREEPAAK